MRRFLLASPFRTFLAAAPLALLLTGCAAVQGYLYDVGLATEREAAGLRPRTVTVESLPMHYYERPSTRRADAPTVVLLHGFGGSKDHWVRFVRYLPPRYRVLALDLPGHGDNPPPPDTTLSIDTLTGRVWATVDALTDGPVALVGNSLGGWIATELALDHPQQVRALALLDPAGVPSPDTSRFERLVLQGENALIPTTAAEYDRLTELAFGDTPPDLPWPAEAVLVRRASEQAPFLRRLFQDLGPRTLPERLPRLRPPVLLLWGAEDEILHPSAADRWAALVPEIDVELLEGVGHAPMLERPEVTAERVARFLARTLG